MLSPKDFYTAGSLTQFVSIDLLVSHHNNGESNYLLGLRNNNPAKGTLFVPGAKTFKNLNLSENLERITKLELGETIGLNDPRVTFIGLFDHQYDHNFKDDNYGTHYVVVAVLIDLGDDLNTVDRIVKACVADQHDSAHWMTKDQILSDQRVHQFNKYYFQDDAPNVFMRQKTL